MTNAQPLSQFLPDAIARMQTQESSTSRPRLPQRWVERLFLRLSAIYGKHFADAWRGCDLDEVKDAWAYGLGDLSAEEIARGIDACHGRPYPPTLPEFRELCRPPVDPEAAYREAVEQMRLRDRGLDRWSDPAIYWAAARIGAWDMRHGSWETLRRRWIAELARALGERRAGTLPDVPPARPTLPPPHKATTPPETARVWIERCRAILRGDAAHA